MTEPPQILASARMDFITQWGALGSAWGINRTMAMIHALLLTSPAPLTTDEVMEALRVSRGNANTNLRDLVCWGLVRKVPRPGERKDYFEAEKDVWRIFCIVARERKRREIEPAVGVLADCADRTEALKDAEGKAFHRTMRELGEFVELAGGMMDRVSASERSKVVPALLKLFK